MGNDLNSFIDSVIKHKKLQFSLDEFDIENSLFKNGILKIENNQISISNYEIVSEIFLEKYKQKLNFSINKSFEKNAEFISNIDNDFNSGRFITDYLNLEKEIWKSIIKESNNGYAYSFTEYLKSINSDDKPDGIYQFIEAYSALLPELNLSEDKIIDNFLILAEITKSEAEYNLDLGNILNGIKKLCEANYDRGLKLLQKSLNLDNRKDVLISAIVTGLYENKGNDFFESILEKLITEEKNRNPIFFGMSKVSDLSDAHCKLFSKLIKQYRSDDTLTISVLSLVFRMLKSDCSSYHQLCFRQLELAVENENTAYYILGNINLKDIYKEEQTNIVVRVINQDYFSIEKYMPAIAHVFFYLKDFESFKKIVLSIIKVCPFQNFARKLQNILHTVDKEKVDAFIIDLLTDNSAGKRFTGLEIFNEMSRTNPYRFSLNILTLPSISQYKLWVALTEDFHQPKDRLTALFPLLDSESELIKESLLCKLEEISEDYGGSILEILETNLDLNNSAYKDIIKRIEDYISNFNNTNDKNSIKELNPYNTHFKYIKNFNDLFHKNMGETIDKSAKENSLLSLLGTNTVQLSKGGGWRNGTDKEIAQLSSFGTSFTMPRSYFIDPNQYDMVKGMAMRKDWSNEEFFEIIKILEDE